MKESNKITVIPYDPSWAQRFELEATQIKHALSDACTAVHHVGSTAVPGLSAKPKIDIIAVVNNDPEETINKLEAIGFTYRGEYNIPMHYGYSKRGKVDVNLHVYQKGHPEIELNLTFRDFLRNHPDMRNEYAALKLRLIEDKAASEKGSSMLSGYNLGKDAFIRKVLKLAGYQRLRFVKCTHHAEWDVARNMRQRYFFDKVPVTDPYGWTFNHPEHAHFVLCRGVDIIGYAHIQLWPQARAAIRIIVVEELERKQGFGKQFLTWIESWLKGKGYASIHAEAAPSAVPFYMQFGYTPMPFHDPEGNHGHPNDTPMGKSL